MKKLLLLSALLISAISFAQIPQGISYQAIALNGTAAVVSSNVGVRLSVLNTSATGATVYAETQTKMTNAQGLFNLVIGQGTPTTGTFAGINWGTGLKFLKVEMDVAGGTNYVLVGTTQLLSTPYSMVAGGLVLAAGQGITLTSPNGTSYVLSVNDAGQLSLPTSGTANTLPTNLYFTGTFNSYNPTTSLLMGGLGGAFYGYKYFTSGSQFKFLGGNTATSVVYGMSSSDIIPNGVAYNIPSNGFYYLRTNSYDLGGTETMYLEQVQSIAPQIYVDGPTTTTLNSTYNVGTNTFSFVANGLTSGANIVFTFENPFNSNVLGDNLADGTIESNGTPISNFPGLNATPKNYRIDLIINFNGSGSYTITQI